MKKVSNPKLQKYREEGTVFYLWGNYTLISINDEEEWIFVWEDTDKEVLTDKNPPCNQHVFDPLLPNVNYWYKNPVNIYKKITQ